MFELVFWTVYGECENVHTMAGHAGAVLELHWSTDGERIYTASTDKTVGVWDTLVGVRIKRIKGHTGFVNSCCPARRGPPLLVSGSDDGSIRIWDTRQKNEIQTLQSTYPVTSVCFSDTAEAVLSAGIDNEIKYWDLRKGQPTMLLKRHTETVTSLALSPDGSFVASNGMDNSVRIWDIRPYVPGERLTKVFVGHQHNFEQVRIVYN
jgi:Prp8 binding protein